MLFVWLVIGVVLLGAELHHLALYLLFGALGAFAAAVVAFAAPGALVAQAAAAVTATGVGLVLVRPHLSAVIHRRDGRSPAKGVHGGFVGHHATALDEIGDASQPGHVRLAGERWLAATDWPHPIGVGVEVVITGVFGTTLHVLPLEPTEGLARSLDLPDASTRSGGEEEVNP